MKLRYSTDEDITAMVTPAKVVHLVRWISLNACDRCRGAWPPTGCSERRDWRMGRRKALTTITEKSPSVMRRSKATTLAEAKAADGLIEKNTTPTGRRERMRISHMKAFPIFSKAAIDSVSPNLPTK